jgi:hypothetical protein
VPEKHHNSRSSVLDTNLKDHLNVHISRDMYEQRRSIFLSSAAHRMSIRSWGSSDVVLSASRVTKSGFAVGLAGRPWDEETRTQTQTRTRTQNQTRDPGRFLHHTAKANISGLVSDTACMKISPKFRTDQCPHSPSRFDHSYQGSRGTWVCLHTQSVHDMTDTLSPEPDDMGRLRPVPKTLTQNHATRVSPQNSSIRPGIHMHVMCACVYGVYVCLYMCVYVCLYMYGMYTYMS